MFWESRTLRGSTVFAKIQKDGSLAADSEGRVEIVYKIAPAAKVYRASSKNLQKTADVERVEFQPAAEAGASSGKPGGATSKAETGTPPKDAIVVYTDGACTGNPGPAGIGATLVDGDKRWEISENIGSGTNNIAELMAILRALESIPAEHRDREVWIHTDSTYSIGVLTKNWKAKANPELIGDIRQTLQRFGRVRFVKVKGHAGIPENERADELARQGISKRR